MAAAKPAGKSATKTPKAVAAEAPASGKVSAPAKLKAVAPAKAEPVKAAPVKVAPVKAEAAKPEPARIKSAEVKVAEVKMAKVEMPKPAPKAPKALTPKLAPTLAPETDLMNAENPFAKQFEAVAPAFEKATADVVSQAQAAQEQFTEKLKELMEKNMKSVTEMSDFAKGNVEALVESAKAAAAGADVALVFGRERTGLVDTIGRAFVPLALRPLLPPTLVSDLSALIAGLATYALMAAVLAFKPTGLFPARG